MADEKSQSDQRSSAPLSPGASPESGGVEERVALDPRSLAALSPDVLAKLRSEFGATVELRASKQGMAALLDNLAGRTPTRIGGGPLAAYDRGFDRTTPGYDKYYDRDRGTEIPVITDREEVTTPVEELDVHALNRLLKRR